MSANPKSIPDLEQLLELNALYIRSVQQSDVAAFRQFLAPEFMCSNSDGSYLDREQFLRASAAPAKISGLQASEVDVRILGDTAVIHGRTSFVKPDGARGGGRYTDVYQRLDGRWSCVAAHVTRG
jgi:ketosteroid isomerase-like protein